MTNLNFFTLVTNYLKKNHCFTKLQSEGLEHGMNITESEIRQRWLGMLALFRNNISNNAIKKYVDISDSGVVLQKEIEPLTPMMRFYPLLKFPIFCLFDDMMKSFDGVEPCYMVGMKFLEDYKDVLKLIVLLDTKEVPTISSTSYQLNAFTVRYATFMKNVEMSEQEFMDRLHLVKLLILYSKPDEANSLIIYPKAYYDLHVEDNLPNSFIFGELETMFYQKFTEHDDDSKIIISGAKPLKLYRVVSVAKYNPFNSHQLCSLYRKVYNPFDRKLENTLYEFPYFWDQYPMILLTNSSYIDSRNNVLNAPNLSKKDKKINQALQEELTKRVQDAVQIAYEVIPKNWDETNIGMVTSLMKEQLYDEIISDYLVAQRNNSIITHPIWKSSFNRLCFSLMTDFVKVIYFYDDSNLKIPAKLKWLLELTTKIIPQDFGDIGRIEFFINSYYVISKRANKKVNFAYEAILKNLEKNFKKKFPDLDIKKFDGDRFVEKIQICERRSRCGTIDIFNL